MTPRYPQVDDAAALLAGLGRAYLAPCLSGDAELNTHGLTNALNMGLRDKQSCEPQPVSITPALPGEAR